MKNPRNKLIGIPNFKKGKLLNFNISGMETRLLGTAVYVQRTTHSAEWYSTVYDLPPCLHTRKAGNVVLTKKEATAMLALMEASNK